MDLATRAAASKPDCNPAAATREAFASNAATWGRDLIAFKQAATPAVIAALCERLKRVENEVRTLQGTAYSLLDLLPPNYMTAPLTHE